MYLCRSRCRCQNIGFTLSERLIPSKQISTLHSPDTHTSHSSLPWSKLVCTSDLMWSFKHYLRVINGVYYTVWGQKKYFNLFASKHGSARRKWMEQDINGWFVWHIQYEPEQTSLNDGDKLWDLTICRKLG